ncbi:MAG: formylglycine-generating enzyme family protein [candidate division KSB1 bacterium]|nr:formylglycine-generating enzyme family protein [candidate division KSB1 bacterium]
MYPWGDKTDPNCANYGDTGIGTTSAVGCFGAGTNHFGLLDMSGNVWEWTRSNYEGYPYQTKCENLAAGTDYARVLRGGAFGIDQRVVRCAYRYMNVPHFRHDFVGFRVVLSPPIFI